MHQNILLLSLALVLAIYLLFRHWERRRQRRPESGWTGRGIDATGLTNQVRRVRNQHASELPPRFHEAFQRQALLTSARRAVRILAYFRGRAAQSATHTENDNETHVA